jgi:GntR family transcriptional regulator
MTAHGGTDNLNTARKPSAALEYTVHSGLTLEAYAADAIDLLAVESTVPLYHQLYRLLKRFIEQGGLSVRDQFPSEASIASLFGVSRPTANRAVQELVSRNWLERERGRGTFVKGQPPIGLALLSDYLSLTEQFPPHATLETTIADRRVLNGPAEVLSKLGLSAGTRILYFRRLRSVNGQPVMVCDAYLPHERFSDLSEDGFVNDSLYATLEERYGFVIERSERSLVAGELLDQQVAEFLGVPPFSPILSLTGLTFVEGETSPIEYMEAYVRECIAFTNTVHRRRPQAEWATKPETSE